MSCNTRRNVEVVKRRVLLRGNLVLTRVGINLGFVQRVEELIDRVGVNVGCKRRE